MKTWKKILLCILALILIAWIVCATMFVTNKNRIKEYSTYCMDEVRNQLWEYLENVSNFYEWKNSEHNWYLYSGKVSYEWIDYDYYCRVSGKDNAEAFLTNLTKWNEMENEPENEEETYDFMNDENLLSIYPELKDWFDWAFILWDVLQTNYINWTNTIYYDPYRWIAFKLWAEFDWGLIREIDTDENGIPHSEIILLVKWDENEENRTWINGFREVYTISVVSKTNLKNFNANPDLANAIWENNEYYFDGYGIDTNIHFSDLQIFDVEEMTY